MAGKLGLRRILELFASEMYSDCVIVFLSDDITSKRPRLTSDGATAASSSQQARETIFGEPLPAHSLVLCVASERFAAQLERWNDRPGRVCVKSPEASAGSADGRIKLHIPLGSVEEVPSTRAAIRFAYTGEVVADSIREVLEVRRQGAYLQITGCTEACDRVVVDKLNDVEEARIYPRNPRRTFELLDCTALWPDPIKEPSFADVLSTAAPQLIKHFHDALKTLTVPKLRDQMLALPAVGMDWLLSSDDFAADSESSVLLLLATWMEVNFCKTDAETRQRLCRKVRLAHLSLPYLSLVLPALAADHEKDPDGPAGWFPIEILEASSVHEFATASKEDQRKMSKWKWGSLVGSLTAVPRRQVDRSTLDWYIPKQRLQEALDLLEITDTSSVQATFYDKPAENPAIALGLNWSVALQVTRDRHDAELLLRCSLPAALKTAGSRLLESSDLPLIPFPTNVELSVDRKHSNETCQFHTDNHMFQMGVFESCVDEQLPLQGPGQLPSAWADYQDDAHSNRCIEGWLTFLDP